MKVSQPHGGALYAGGVPGNRGGYGRPPRVTVREVHEDLPALLDRLRRAAQNERTPVRDLVAIARLLIEVAAEAGLSDKPPLRIWVNTGLHTCPQCGWTDRPELASESEAAAERG